METRRDQISIGHQAIQEMQLMNLKKPTTYEAICQLARTALKLIWDEKAVEGSPAVTLYSRCIEWAGELEAERWEQGRTQE